MYLVRTLLFNRYPEKTFSRETSVNMARVLHILKSEPDETVARVIEAQSHESEVAVVSLYRDEITGHAVDWSRLVEDIFAYDRVICWW